MLSPSDNLFTTTGRDFKINIHIKTTASDHLQF